MLREVGIESSTMKKDHGQVFVVKALAVEYKKPAHLDDLLEVRTSIEKIGGASMTGSQRVFRGDDELVHLTVTLVCMDEQEKAVRIDGALRDTLEQLCAT
jgi:acyl-CoA thioester hydrolase